jgi:general secretion pathway protein D
MALRPVVSFDGRYVQLAMEPSFSGLQGTRTVSFNRVDDGVSYQDDYELNTRTFLDLRATITVPDGGTAVLGGTTAASDVRIESGVPVLSKIPLIGNLFKTTSNVREKKVTVILVTPHVIIRDEQEARL